MKMKFTNSLYMFSKFIITMAYQIFWAFYYFLLSFISRRYSLVWPCLYCIYFDKSQTAVFIRFLKPDLVFKSKIGFFSLFYLFYLIFFLSIFSLKIIFIYLRSSYTWLQTHLLYFQLLKGYIFS